LCTLPHMPLWSLLLWSPTIFEHTLGRTHTQNMTHSWSTDRRLHMEQDTYVEKDSYTARIRRIEKTFFRLYRIHFGNHASNTLCFAGVGPQKNLILARSSNNPGIRARTSRRPGADCRAHHSKTFQDTHSASGDGSWAPHSYGALGFNSRRLQNANWLFKSEGLPRRWRPLSLSLTHTHTQTHTHTHTHTSRTPSTSIQPDLRTPTHTHTESKSQ
jgi:hypothetical protein